MKTPAIRYILLFRFGDGYTVIVRVSGEQPDMESVVDFFTAEFPGALLKVRHWDLYFNKLQNKPKTTFKLFQCLCLDMILSPS